MNISRDTMKIQKDWNNCTDFNTVKFKGDENKV